MQNPQDQNSLQKEYSEVVTKLEAFYRDARAGLDKAIKAYKEQPNSTTADRVSRVIGSVSFYVKNMDNAIVHFQKENIDTSAIQQGRDKLATFATNATKYLVTLLENNGKEPEKPAVVVQTTPKAPAQSSEVPNAPQEEAKNQVSFDPPAGRPEDAQVNEAGERTELRIVVSFRSPLALQHILGEYLRDVDEKKKEDITRLLGDYFLGLSPERQDEILAVTGPSMVVSSI